EEEPFAEIEAKVLVANPVVGSVSYENIPAGYKLDAVNSTELPFTVTVEANVIKVYYIVGETQELEYTVEYYMNGEEEPFEVIYGLVLASNPVVENVSYENMPIGFELDEAISTELPFEVFIAEQDIIKVYYKARTDISYTVNYYLNNTTTSVASTKIVENQTFGNDVTENAISISGYSLVSQSSVTITLELEDNVINFYYRAVGSSDDDSRDDDSRDDDNRTDDSSPPTIVSPSVVEEEEVIELLDDEIPLGALDRENHFQYLRGYPDNTIRPEGLITREEVAAVFYRLLTDSYRESIFTMEHSFTDVEEGRWSTKHIATLANAGIIKGYSDGTFRPGQYITKAELAVIASRFDKLSPFEGDSFSDISDHWANTYINSAAAKGWVNGYSDGTFKPDKYISRAEFVTLVNNVLGRKVKKEDILPEARQFPDLDESAWYYEAIQAAINSHYYIRLEDGYQIWTEIYYPELDM
ncbi:S-layer homology domain-containing protein, partial [Alkaliphilus peptidifermentans]